MYVTITIRELFILSERRRQTRREENEEKLNVIC